jgi:hypothetical protein
VQSLAKHEHIYKQDSEERLAPQDVKDDDALTSEQGSRSDAHPQFNVAAGPRRLLVSVARGEKPRV